MATVEEVRALALLLPRTTEHLIRDRVKFRVGRLVYVAFSRDEELMGFAFPKAEREGLVASDPERYLMPGPADLRYQWVVCRVSLLDHDEMTERVTEAWSMCVPKKVVAEYFAPAPPR